MVGHRLLGTSLLDGETAKAREHLERATKLYDANRRPHDRRHLRHRCAGHEPVEPVHRLLAAGPGHRSGRARAQARWSWQTQLGHAHHPRLRVCPRLHAAHAGARHTNGQDPGTADACGRNQARAAALDFGGAGIPRLVRGRVRPPGGRNRHAGEAARFPAIGAPRLLAADLSVLAGRGLCPRGQADGGQALSRRRRATSSGEAATTGTRSNACGSKGASPRTRKSMMRRRPNSASSRRWRSPASADNGICLARGTRPCLPSRRQRPAGTGARAAARRAAVLRRSAGPRRSRRRQSVVALPPGRVSMLTAS